MGELQLSWKYVPNYVWVMAILWGLVSTGQNPAMLVLLNVILKIIKFSPFSYLRIVLQINMVSGNVKSCTTEVQWYIWLKNLAGQHKKSIAEVHCQSNGCFQKIFKLVICSCFSQILHVTFFEVATEGPEPLLSL